MVNDCCNDRVFSTRLAQQSFELAESGNNEHRTWYIINGNSQQNFKASSVCPKAYCSFHVLWPMRHVLHEESTGWTEQEHYFAWRMMLRGKSVGLRYYLTNPETGLTQQADIRQFLNPEQQIKFATDPKMILDLAHGLAAESLRRTGKQTEVRALVLASLNGRKPQLLIDPAVDLAAQPRFALYRPWIVPLQEPLRKEPWTVPLNEWERHVDLPDLPFLNPQTPTSANHSITGCHYALQNYTEIATPSGVFNNDSANSDLCLCSGRGSGCDQIGAES